MDPEEAVSHRAANPNIVESCDEQPTREKEKRGNPQVPLTLMLITERAGTTFEALPATPLLDAGVLSSY